MSVKIKIETDSTRRSLIGCLSLALLATTISLSLSVLTGWQLGESLKEKLVIAAVGVLAVLGAHLLLALCQPASIKVRMVAAMLWLLCIVYVAYSHANFFLSSLQQAGMRRVATVSHSSSRPEPNRNLSAVLFDQARIKTELAAKSRLYCGDDCSSLRAKVISLQAKLDVLNAEADEVKRWQAEQDRQEAHKDFVRNDPVTMRLAIWLNVTTGQVGLVTGLLFSIILEGVACLCWYVALQFRDSSVTQSVIPEVAIVPELTGPGNVDDARSRTASELDSKVDELLREVRAGRLKLTVNSVRDYCHCAQKKASELKRLVEARLNAETQIV